VEVAGLFHAVVRDDEPWGTYKSRHERAHDTAIGSHSGFLGVPHSQLCRVRTLTVPVCTISCRPGFPDPVPGLVDCTNIHLLRMFTLYRSLRH